MTTLLRYGLLLLLLVACASPPSQVAATDTANLSDEAEAFRADAQRQIDQAAAAVREAERVVAEQQRAAEVARKAARAARSRVTTPRARTAPTYTGTLDAAFWRRLANCESADGRSGRYKGYFQFSSDTARKVGWYEGASYEAQVGMAQKWLGMIGGRGGSRSGWPVCWWRAMA